MKAFEKFGYNSDNILWVSDDFSKKWHVDRVNTPGLGWTYPVGSHYDDNIVFDYFEFTIYIR